MDFTYFNAAGWQTVATIFFITGVIVAFAVNMFLLPDPWSKWLGERKNAPGLLGLIGTLFLVIIVVNVLAIIAQALAMTHYEPWFWVILVVGVVFAGVGAARALKWI